MYFVNTYRVERFCAWDKTDSEHHKFKCGSPRGGGRSQFLIYLPYLQHREFFDVQLMKLVTKLKELEYFRGLNPLPSKGNMGKYFVTVEMHMF